MADQVRRVQKGKVQGESSQHNPESVVSERSGRLGQSPEKSMSRNLKPHKDFGQPEYHD
jgi:hypothetical protein